MQHNKSWEPWDCGGWRSKIVRTGEERNVCSWSPVTETEGLSDLGDGWAWTACSNRINSKGKGECYFFHTGFTTFLWKFNLTVLFSFANQNQFNCKSTRRAYRGGVGERIFCNSFLAPSWETMQLNYPVSGAQGPLPTWSRNAVSLLKIGDDERATKGNASPRTQWKILLD